jgi:exosortase B
VLYAPVYWSAAHGVWQTDENGHGPLILAVVVWLFWTLRQPIAEAAWEPAPALGWPVFVFGLLVYALGRAFDISSLEFGSQPFVVAGALMLLRGLSALRVAWFAVAYLVFLVPLPATLVDAMTGPLKQWISSIVQSMLFAVGYPISNSGVILTIGQFQLMVADACSGLNSMFSLSALGTLFMYVMRRKSLLHNAIMLASILPIAFAANIVRVTLLVLLTYHFGDEAGQGFLHGAAGMALMVIALLIFFVLDAVIASAMRLRASAGATPAR